MTNITPAQLAQRFKLSTSTGTLQLVDGTDFGGIDTMQVPLSFRALDLSLLAEAGGPFTLDQALVDLTEMADVRLATLITTAVISSHEAIMYLQYSLDGSTWSTLTTNTVDIESTGLKRTEWEVIPDAAKTIVLVRGFAAGGSDENDSAAARGLTASFRR